MRDRRQVWQAVIAATAAVSTCAALTLVAAAQDAGAATPRAAAGHPKPTPGRVIHGDIVPGRSADVTQHRRGKTAVTKVLVILGYWGKHDSTTPAEAKKLVITEANDWYRRASYGKQGLTGAATKWLRVPQPKHCGDIDDATFKAAVKAADKAHYHPSGYDRIVLYEPCKNPNSIGIGNLPGNHVVLTKGGMNLPTAVHEQGHNYGLGHANQLVCTEHGSRATYQPGASCKTQEYDDFSSAMSAQWSSKYAGDFTAPQKDKLGWLAGHEKTVSHNGTVTLGAYESTSGTHAIKIPGSNGRTYWVEYRTDRGNDTHLPAAYDGVLIHMSKSGGGAARLNQSLLLHAFAPDPSVPGFDHAAGPAYLPPLSSWTTPDGIQITVDSESSGSAKITVTRGVHAGKPGAAQDQSATALDGSATVTFHRAADGGLPIRSYTVTAHAGQQDGPHVTVTDHTGHTTLHATVGGLTNGQAYSFSIKATNEAGSGPSANTAQVTPEVSPPTAEITNASDLTGGVSGVVTVDATGIPNPVTDAKITELELRVDGKEIGDVTASSRAFTWDTGEAPGFAQDADHTITVITTDANGRTGTATQTVHLVHSTGPTLTFNGFTAVNDPAQGDIHVNGAATKNPAGHAVASLVVTVSDAKGETQLDEITDPGDMSPFAVDWHTLSADFFDGNQTVTITATDSAGKESIFTTTVGVRTPSVTFTGPSGTVHGNEDFTGTVTNNTPVAGMTVQVQLVPVSGPTQAIGMPLDLPNLAPGATAPFDIVVDMDNQSTGKFTVEAEDATTRTTSPLARTLTVVQEAPTVTLTAPGANAVVHDTVHFTGTATNNSGTDGLTITVTQGQSTIVSPTPLDIDAGAMGSYDVSGSVGGLPDASASFAVTVTDNKTQPQSSNPATRSLVVSHVPDVTLSTPLTEDQVFGGVHFTGSVTTHSAKPDVTVAVTTDGGAVSPASQNVTVSPHGSANFDVVEDVDLVNSGDQTFTVTVTDGDGLVTTTHRDLTVIHPDPALSVTTAPDPNTLVPDSAEFKGSATNNSGTNGLTLTLDVSGVTVQTVDLDIAAGATGTFDVTQDVSTLDVGSDVFDVVVTDINGLSTDDSRQLRVDHPPVVTVTSPTEDQTVSAGMSVTVTGTVSNGAPDDGNPTVTASAGDDQGTDTPTVAQGDTGSYSIDLDLSDLTGPQTITVTATDASGVTTTPPVTVDVTVGP